MAGDAPDGRGAVGLAATYMRQKQGPSRVTAAQLKHQIPDVSGVAQDLYSIDLRNGVARCPFGEKHSHGDRDPSLRFEMRKKRLFCASQQCFGEKGVNAIGLVQRMEPCNFRTALQRLSWLYNDASAIGWERGARWATPMLKRGSGRSARSSARMGRVDFRSSDAHQTATRPVMRTKHNS